MFLAEQEKQVFLFRHGSCLLWKKLMIKMTNNLSQDHVVSDYTGNYEKVNYDWRKERKERRKTPSYLSSS